MPITIQSFGENETPDAIKAAYPDADVVITKQGQTPPAKESNSADELKAKQEEEAKPNKEEAEPKKPEEGKEAEKPVKAKAKDVDDEGFPKEAIDQIAKLRRERREARERAEDLEAENSRLKKAGKSSSTATAEPETPTTYSGKPKPTIDQYTSQPDKYPDPYAAFAEDIGEWKADEKLAKRDADERERQAQERAQEQQAHFDEVRTKLEATFPDLDEVIHSDAAKKVLLSEKVIAAIKESEVGPAVLRHLVLNPEIAAGWLKKPEASQVAAYGKLEAQIEIEIEKVSKKEPAKEKSEDPPAKPKQQSKAPDPPERLKPNGNPASTSRDVAGESGNITTVRYDSSYERRRREEGYKGY